MKKNGEKSKTRGFAGMDKAKHHELAAKGGRAAHEQGTGHEWKSGKEAQDAGRKGGQTSRGGRGRLVVPENSEENPSPQLDDLGGLPDGYSK